MNYLFPVAAAGGFLSLLLPSLLAKLFTPPQPSHSPGGGPWCEGYYPDAEVCQKLGSGRPSAHRRRRANAHCPQWRIDPAWAAGAGRWTLVDRLGEVEAMARLWEGTLAEMEAEDVARCGGVDDGPRPDGGGTARPPVWLRRERGVAWSRVKEGVMAGNSEFHCDRPGDGGRGKTDRGPHVCWTDAVLPLYIEKHGVRPSREFEVFVLSFDLEGFRAGLDGLRACARVTGSKNDEGEVGKAATTN